MAKPIRRSNRAAVAASVSGLSTSKSGTIRGLARLSLKRIYDLMLSVKESRMPNSGS